MAILNCSAHSCMSNRGGKCTLSGILVKGDNVCCSADTFCGSYAPVRNSPVNAVFPSKGNTAVNIRCKASDCMFNRDMQCEADTVQIWAPSHEGETAQCATFKARF